MKSSITLPASSKGSGVPGPSSLGGRRFEAMDVRMMSDSSFERSESPVGDIRVCDVNFKTGVRDRMYWTMEKAKIDKAERATRASGQLRRYLIGLISPAQGKHNGGRCSLLPETRSKVYLVPDDIASPHLGIDRYGDTTKLKHKASLLPDSRHQRYRFSEQTIFSEQRIFSEQWIFSEQRIYQRRARSDGTLESSTGTSGAKGDKPKSSSSQEKLTSLEHKRFGRPLRHILKATVPLADCGFL